MSKPYIARSTLWGTVQCGAVFYSLPERERAAVMAHEHGHLRHFHAWKRLWAIVSGKTTEQYYAMCREQEHEADAYAAKRGHGAGMISLLLRIRDRESDLHPSYKQRIDRIMRHG